MRRFIILLLLITITAFFSGSILNTAAGQQTVPVLLVEGEPFATEGTLEIVDGEVFLPLRVLVVAFGAKLRWLTDEQSYLLTMGQTAVQISADSKQINVNGRIVELRFAPRVIKSRTMIPVELVASYLPVQTVWNAQRSSLDLRWLLNELTMFAAGLNAEGRPVVAIETLNELGDYQVNESLSRPDRIVIDLIAIKTAASLESRNDGNPIVRKLQFEALEPNKVRLTVDLLRAAQYKVVRYPGESNHLEIHFDYALRAVRLTDQEGWPQILIDTGGKAAFKTFTLPNPERLVIDLANTVNTLSETNLTVSGTLITAVRSSQFNSTTTRVVIDLTAARKHHAEYSPDNPGVIRISFQRQIDSLQWAKERDTLSIAGEGRLAAQSAVNYTSEGAQLILTIPNAVMSDKAVLPDAAGNKYVRKVSLTNGADGSVAIKLDLALYGGHYLTHNEDGSLALTLLRSNVAGKTIIVDPGHGGKDPGAISPWGLPEKQVNLAVAQKLMWRLQAAGATVVMTRAEDSYSTKYDRADFANTVNGDVFISIHSNFHPTKDDVRGIETFHHPASTEARRLAKIVQTELLAFTGLRDRGVKTDPLLVVTRETVMPSVLIEIGFLSNREEEALLRDDAHRDKVADAMLEALQQYFSSGEFRPSGPSGFSVLSGP
ncbi:MAG TPA: hypothetical protein DHD79_07995 [Firmicutes bacterium]|nr:hypothetical protein [Bacillota bacterium]HAW71991.1 hypothetical protein [Bacillota bacterium]HAZ23049.1 hypothetical protein [Bacillota bacterium]HBL49265.1 hypothetical protein [Bacillota bacterium]HBL69316.1 hypothetical protein [Bacillota bacterium]